MVVFLDLDEDDVSDTDPHADPVYIAGCDWALRQRVSKPRDVMDDNEDAKSEGGEGINLDFTRLSAALNCYPYFHIGSDLESETTS